MIAIRTGNLLRSKAQTLVNTVNTVGIMGKGIALAFKKAFPDMYEDYVKRCDRGEVVLGRPYPYALPDGRIVLNFPTKEHWRAVSRLDTIVEGLEHLKSHYKEWGVKSIAVPPLGCGNGQLEWRVVGPTLHRHLSELDIPVEIYAPHGTPQAEMQLDFFGEDHSASSIEEPSKIAPAWVALVDVLARITSQRYHWPVGRTRFQKLAYFLAAAGIPMGFEHRRGSYGPYAEDLKPVVARLINNGLVAEHKRGQMFAVEVGPTFEDARSAFLTELESWNEELDRVADLFARLPTDQTEVAATVHLVASELGASGAPPTEVEVLKEVMRWKARRRPPLDADVVAPVIRNLAMLRWIQVQPSAELGDEDELLVGLT